MAHTAKVKTNFLYSISYQMLTIILPLITAPYLARTLGADMVGVYSKTHALAHYFYLFTILGINNYGNRAIARVRDDRASTSKTFWEIYMVQAVASVSVLILYIAFCLSFEHEYKIIYIIQGLYVLSGLFEVNWFCFGLEKFKLTTIRSTVVRLIILVAVFVFVRTKADLWKYVLILSSSSVLSVLAVWPFVLRYTEYVKPTWDGVKPHIKPILILFWPTIAISLYNIMDKIILGYFNTNSEVAFYSYSERIVTIPTTLILALDSVVMPRMSNIIARKDTKKAQALMDYVMLFAMFLATSMTFGLAGISDVFAPWFYGNEFAKCGYYILLLSPTILFKGWAGALRTQFIIPSGRDRIYIISLTCGAVVNLILDFVLIPRMAGVGAIIGTLAAELSVALIQFAMCKNDIPIKEYMKNGISFIVIGFVMFICVRGIMRLNLSAFPTLIIQIGTGTLIYSVLAFAYMIRTNQPVLINEMLKTMGIKYRFS